MAKTEQKDALTLEFEKLQLDLEQARATRAYWQTRLDEAEFETLIDGLKGQVEALKESLTALDLKADETVSKRAQIRAYRDMVARVEHKASDGDVQTAEGKVRAFRKKNALFFAEKEERGKAKVEKVG